MELLNRGIYETEKSWQNRKSQVYKIGKREREEVNKNLKKTEELIRNKEVSPESMSKWKQVDQRRGQTQVFL